MHFIQKPFLRQALAEAVHHAEEDDKPEERRDVGDLGSVFFEQAVVGVAPCATEWLKAHAPRGPPDTVAPVVTHRPERAVQRYRDELKAV